MVALVALVLFEGGTPAAIHAMTTHADSWERDPGSTLTLAKALALCRFDVLVMYNFLRAMQVVVCPVSVLAYFSAKKLERRKAKASEHLDFSPRNAYSLVAVTESLDGSLEKAEQQQQDSTCFDTMRRLFSRYTVVYSFLKLVASIVLSLVLNDGYSFCREGHMTAAECPQGCAAHCAFPTTHYTDGESAYLHHCNSQENPYSQVHSSCFCDNWLTTDFVVLVMNVAHYTLQCYYYLHYNNFDPQQNQIDCVQSYSFVGDNITLFLTHPAISLLSVLESVILVASWTGVLRHDGLSCSSYVDGVALPDHQSALIFALFMTFIEIYKANTTVALRHWQAEPREWGWAAFSLLRLDLFVFYGSTLFLQTFLFPLSIAGYLIEQARGALGEGEGGGGLGGEESATGSAGTPKEALLAVKEEDEEN